MIHSFHARGERPTLEKIFIKLIEEASFPHSKSVLCLMLIKLEFRCKRRRYESITHERPDLITWREKKLRKIKEIREPEREIKCTEETWINSGIK